MTDSKVVEHTAQIIEFPQEVAQQRSNKPKGLAPIKKQETAFVIPQLYRLRGYYFNTKKRTLVMSNRPAPASYTLHNQPSDFVQVANPEWDPIERLESNFDRGWVIIRRHYNAELALGYLDAQNEMANTYLPPCLLFSTEKGYFTVAHRKRLRNLPDCLVIHIQKRSGLSTNDLIEEMSSADQYIIRHPDGKDTHDPGILYTA